MSLHARLPPQPFTLAVALFISRLYNTTTMGNARVKIIARGQRNRHQEFDPHNDIGPGIYRRLGINPDRAKSS